jgi:hypothetical protein
VLSTPQPLDQHHPASVSPDAHDWAAGDSADVESIRASDGVANWVELAKVWLPTRIYGSIITKEEIWWGLTPKSLDNQTGHARQRCDVLSSGMAQIARGQMRQR